MTDRFNLGDKLRLIRKKFSIMYLALSPNISSGEYLIENGYTNVRSMESKEDLLDEVAREPSVKLIILEMGKKDISTIFELVDDILKTCDGCKIIVITSYQDVRLTFKLYEHHVMSVFMSEEAQIREHMRQKVQVLLEASASKELMSSMGDVLK